MLQFFFSIFSFLLSVEAFALYNGNPYLPMMPEDGLLIPEEVWIGVKGGYEWDDCYNHYLEWKDPPTAIHHDIEKFSMMGNFGVITVNFRNRVEAYGTLGTALARIDQNLEGVGSVAYKTDTDFAWSVGGRALLAYFGDFRFSLDAKYFEMHPDVRSISVGSFSILPTRTSLAYQEWQVGGSICYSFSYFAPYVGLKHANVTGTLSHLPFTSAFFPKQKLALKGRYDIGVFAGLGVFSPKGFNFNMEWRFVDEFGVTLAADIRF